MSTTIGPMAALMLAASSAVFALSSDQSQPMHIEADQVVLDDQRQLGVYTGNVVVTQGTLRITADRLTVRTQKRRVRKIVAQGEPATYRQRPDNEATDVRAEALTMIYMADQDLVILEGDAHLWQEHNSFSSNRIVYERASDRVRAGQQDGGDRVEIIIQPRPRESE